MTNIKKSIVTGLILGLTCGIYIAIKTNEIFAVIAGVPVFVVGSIGSYFKFFYKIDDSKEFRVINNESVIYSGFANHLKDGICVGGTFYLCGNELIFQTNALNFMKKHELILAVEDVISVDFTNTLGMISNGLSITTNYGIEQFVVYKRQIWRDLLEEAIAKQRQF